MMPHRLLITTLFLTCLLPCLPMGNTLLAQDGCYRRFDIEDGLPSNHVHCVFADSRGAIWAGTPGGAVRYDGYDFQVFDHASGLPQNEILNILEDREGTIWLQSFNHLVRLNQDQRFHTVELPFPAYYRQAPRIHLMNGHLATFNEVRAFSNWIRREENWQTLAHSANRDYVPVYRGIWQTSKAMFGANNCEIVSITDSFKLIQEGNFHPTLQPVRIDADRSLLFTTETPYLFNGTQAEPVHLLDEKGEPLGHILAAHSDSSGNLWISTSGKGLYRYLSRGFTDYVQPVEHGLVGEEITWITHDREGNLWLGTIRSGLLMRPAASLLFHAWSEAEGLGGRSIEAIAVGADQKVHLAHANNRVSTLIGHQIIRSSQVARECRKCRLRALKTISENRLVALMNEGVFIRNPGQHWRPQYTGAVKCIASYGQHFLIGNNRGLYHLEPDVFEASWPGSMPGRMIHNQRTYAVMHHAGLIWIGTNDGLSIRNARTNTLLKETPPILRQGFSVTAIRLSPAGEIWISTHEKGVFIVRGDQVRQLSMKQGLSSNDCREIEFDPGGGAWIATQKGINYLPPQKGQQLPQVRILDRREGLPSEDIHCLKMLNDRILAGTSRGLVSIPRSFFEEQKATLPTIKLDSVFAAGKQIDLGAPLKFSHKENEIAIWFSMCLPRAAGTQEFRFRMLGLGNERWTQTTSRRALFYSLAPGSYTFEVQGRMRHRQWGAVHQLAISITPPFTATWMFLTLISGGGLCSFLLLARWRVRYVRRREQEAGRRKKQLIELRLQVLRSQMRPHFIFNALSAIQHFITAGKGQAAHHYLSTFARLIRRVLEHSRTNLISLSEEVQTLDLYLEIESLRFPERLNYTISVAPDIPQNQIMVPPMLVQPFVENAIQHGLRHKVDPGNLNIHFFKQSGTLICDVKDDGIGREASAALKSDLTDMPSRATEILEAHILSLNELIQTQASIEIEDLVDHQGKASGTLVRIRFPYVEKL